jgi:SAM-dependent methyltransferase
VTVIAPSTCTYKIPVLMGPITRPPGGSPIPDFEPAPPLTELPRRARDGELLLAWDRGPSSEPLVAPLTLNGWAYTKGGVAEVWGVVDATNWVRGLHGMWRSDVMRVLEDRDAGGCGYRVLLTPEDCPPGTHQVTVVALDATGRAVGLTDSIEICAYDSGPLPANGDRTLPAPKLPLDGNGERFVPEIHEGGMIEAEHEARYRWAAALASGRTVLDAGCGVGWGSAVLSEAGAERVVGIDVNPEALASARERTGDRAATFVQGDLQELPFADGSFDLIVCFEAIEHVQDPERALDAIRRVLAPGGLLVISSPNRGVYPSCNPHHVREYASDELDAALRDRFAHVAPYRQQTHVGSLISDDEEFEVADAGTPLDVDVRKVVGGSPGDELYTVAIAGDGELPELPGMAVLTSHLDVRTWYEAMTKVERRALLAEADVAALTGETSVLGFEHDQALLRLRGADQARRENEARASEAEARAQDAETRLADVTARLQAAERRAEAAEHWLTDHQASVSWRVTTPLRAAKRGAQAARRELRG